jgi:hypothetical protein
MPATSNKAELPALNPSSLTESGKFVGVGCEVEHVTSRMPDFGAGFSSLSTKAVDKYVENRFSGALSGLRAREFASLPHLRASRLQRERKGC